MCATFNFIETKDAYHYHENNAHHYHKNNAHYYQGNNIPLKKMLFFCFKWPSENHSVKHYKFSWKISLNLTFEMVFEKLLLRVLLLRKCWQVIKKCVWGRGENII